MPYPRMCRLPATEVADGGGGSAYFNAGEKSNRRGDTVPQCLFGTFQGIVVSDGDRPEFQCQGSREDVSWRESPV